MSIPRFRIQTLMIAVAVAAWLAAVISRSWALAFVETQLALMFAAGMYAVWNVEHLARRPLFVGLVGAGMSLAFLALDLWLIPYMVLNR